MIVHQFLSRYLPPVLANALTGVWFAFVLALVLLAASNTSGEFRYTDF